VPSQNLQVMGVFPANHSAVYGLTSRIYYWVCRVGGLVLEVYLVHNVGGVTHYHLHCRLAKFRGLMKRGKYGALIG